MRDLLFVYGTLGSGFDNFWARKLRASARMVGTAKVRGCVFDWGSYPGFRPRAAGEVAGEVWELTEPEVLAVLDEYEGAEFERAVTETTDGVRVWIYQLAAEPSR